jgi:nitrite reductase/ring-hydroxylating ferredoxin subunit
MRSTVSFSIFRSVSSDRRVAKMQATTSEPMWIKVAEHGALAARSLTQAEAAGKTLVLANANGRITALDDRCPHFGASLADGQIEGELLVCPWHGREFDLRTGSCAISEGVNAYPVEVRDDGIYVMVPT